MTESQFTKELPNAMNMSRPSVFRILGRQPDYVDDILQNASLKAWRGLKRFKGDSKFSTWFCRIAMNEALMWLRANRIRVESLDEILENLNSDEFFAGATGSMRLPINAAGLALEFKDKFASPNPSPESECITRDLISKVISKKSPVSNPAMILRERDGWSHRDLSKLFGVSENAVKARIYNAKESARKQAERLGIRGC